MDKASETYRKSPKQSRSQAIVDAIYEATVRILPKIGGQNITTRKIAEIAGISVGSLYQYFPNKEAVLGALMDRVMQSEMERFQAHVQNIDGRSMEDATSAMVDFALELFLSEKEKISAIFQQAPELGRIPSILKLRQQTVERLAEEMKKHYPGEDHEESIRVSFIAVNSVMGVIHTMLYDNSQAYTKEQLSLELRTMLNSYFRHRTQILKMK